MKTLALLFMALISGSSLAQVSDSTAIAGAAGAAPTLDCASDQVKVGSACAIIIRTGAAEGGGCTRTGIGTLGFDSGGELFQCVGSVWKKARYVIPPPPPPAGCPSPTGVGTVPHGWNGTIGSWGCTINSTCANGYYYPPPPECGYM